MPLTARGLSSSEATIQQKRASNCSAPENGGRTSPPRLIQTPETDPHVKIAYLSLTQSDDKACGLCSVNAGEAGTWESGCRRLVAGARGREAPRSLASVSHTSSQTKVGDRAESL